MRRCNIVIGYLWQCCRHSNGVKYGDPGCPLIQIITIYLSHLCGVLCGTSVWCRRLVVLAECVLNRLVQLGKRLSCTLIYQINRDVISRLDESWSICRRSHALQTGKAPIISRPTVLLMSSVAWRLHKHHYHWMEENKPIADCFTVFSKITPFSPFNEAPLFWIHLGKPCNQNVSSCQTWTQITLSQLVFDTDQHCLGTNNTCHKGWWIGGGGC